MEAEFIRNTILKNLKNEADFNCMVSAEINGINFTAADVALPGGSNDCTVFRLIMSKHFLTVGAAKIDASR